MVMMFEGGVVLVLNGIPVLFLLQKTYRAGVFRSRPNPYLWVKRLYVQHFSNCEFCPHIASASQFSPYMTTLSTFLVDKKHIGKKTLARIHFEFRNRTPFIYFPLIFIIIFRLRVPTRHWGMVVPAAQGGGVCEGNSTHGQISAVIIHQLSII